MALRDANGCLILALVMRINTDYKLAILTLPSPASKPDIELLSLQQLQSSEWQAQFETVCLCSMSSHWLFGAMENGHAINQSQFQASTLSCHCAYDNRTALLQQFRIGLGLESLARVSQ